MRKGGYKVPAKSKKDIENIANRVRDLLGLHSGVQMYKILEFVIPRIDGTFELQIVPDLAMGGDEARTYPDKNIIRLSDTTYSRAISLNGRANFTLAHELGHLFLHRGLPPSYARKVHENEKLYKNSEWQADKFASYFLMPEIDVIATCSSPKDIAARYYTSHSAATYRWREITGSD